MADPDEKRPSEPEEISPPPPSALGPDRMAEVLRDSLREESSFWTQVHEMGPKLRMLALAIFALACLFALGLWLLQSSVEGQKAVKDRPPAPVDAER